MIWVLYWGEILIMPWSLFGQYWKMCISDNEWCVYLFKRFHSTCISLNTSDWLNVFVCLFCFCLSHSGMVWRTLWMMQVSCSSSWTSCPPSAAVSTRRRAPCWCSSSTSPPSPTRSCSSPPTPAPWTSPFRKVRTPPQSQAPLVSALATAYCPFPMNQSYYLPVSQLSVPTSPSLSWSEYCIENISNYEYYVCVCVGRLTWLVYIIGAVIGGRVSFASTDEQDAMDGELVCR